MKFFKEYKRLTDSHDDLENLNSGEIHELLLDMVKKDRRNYRLRAPFLGANYNKARKCGEVLHRKYGLNTMVRICESMPRDDARELEFVWDGIGNWRA